MAPAVPVIDLFADAPVGNPKASAYLLAAYAQWFAAGLLATQLVGEPITINLIVGLIAVFAGI